LIRHSDSPLIGSAKLILQENRLCLLFFHKNNKKKMLVDFPPTSEIIEPDNPSTSRVILFLYNNQPFTTALVELTI